MPQLDIMHMAQPVVGQTDAGATQSRQHAAAAVMADHHDVLDLEVVDRELDHRQSVEVGVHHHIGHVAVHKDLARIQSGDLVGRYPAVGTANPQVLGRLLLRQQAEKTRALPLHAGRPDAVVVEQVLQ